MCLQCTRNRGCNPHLLWVEFRKQAGIKGMLRYVLTKFGKQEMGLVYPIPVQLLCKLRMMTTGKGMGSGLVFYPIRSATSLYY